MKTITIILALLFSQQLFSQHHFLSRKYMKGRFVERIRKLHHKKEMTVSLDSMKMVYPLTINRIEPQTNAPDSIHSGICIPKQSIKKVTEDFHNANTHPKGIKNKGNYANPLTKYNVLLYNKDKPVAASFEKRPLIVSHATVHKGALPIKTHNRKSVLRLCLEWDNLKHLKITGYSPQAVGLSLINYYQNYISPKKGFTCAHKALHQNEASCSEYGKQAIEKYGIVKGVYMAGKRLNDCGDAYAVLKVKDTLHQTTEDLWGCNGMIDDCKKELVLLLIGTIVLLVVSGLLITGIMPLAMWASLCILAFIVITTNDIIHFCNEDSDCDSLPELFKKIAVTNLLGILALFLLPALLIAA